MEKYRKGKRIDFYLDDEAYAQMDELCAKHKLSKSVFIRKAIKHFIDINNTAAVRAEVKKIYAAKKGD